jgi:hypothetical protein
MLMKFEKPFFVSSHAVEQFQARVANISAAKIINLVQSILQDPGLPVDVTYTDNQLSPIYRAVYAGKNFYIPVVKGQGEWPAVPTILGEESHIHWKFRRGKLTGLHKKEELGGCKNE